MPSIHERVRGIRTRVTDLEAVLPPGLRETKTAVQQAQKLFKTKELREFVPVALDVYNQVTLTSDVNDINSRLTTMEKRIGQLQATGKIPPARPPWGWIVGSALASGGIVWMIRR